MKKKELPVREIIFGLEDGIVSTLGVLVGIAVGTNNKSFVILSGLVIVIVESLSMAAGTYLSNKSELELHLSSDKKHPLLSLFHCHSSLPIKESFYMGISYILGGLVSLSGFFFLDPSNAILAAILLSSTTLFIMGFIKGKLAQINPLKSGLEMVLVSASASFIGYIVGKTASVLLSKL
ncbi:VIT1/CCC1 transporter family protein [Patescibacteria group bacterium]|nr:VIT1/CCC1 transporter family protein [Patescibacteria group bacterium]MBU1256100.1 VIT1/CCC1 transporter family protein [Patescibacteria group bacterium]MBU1457229.1 VIT1/CCC1 transporter family protein [Patescibacteria group bacterium]